MLRCSVGGLHFFGILGFLLASFFCILFDVEVSTLKTNINYNSDWWFMLVAYTVGASTSTHPSNTQNNQNPSLKLLPWKLTCPPKGDCFNRTSIFQPLTFRGYASFQGSNHIFKQKMPMAHNKNPKIFQHHMNKSHPHPTQVLWVPPTMQQNPHMTWSMKSWLVYRDLSNGP